MRRNFSRVFRTTVALMLIATMTLCGCGKVSNEIENGVEEAKEAATKEAIEVMEQESQQSETEEETEAEVVYSMPEEAVSASAIVIGDKAYFIGNHEIMLMDMNTGEAELIWEDDFNYSPLNSYNIGRGILLYDKIYFYTEDYDEEGNSIKKLYCLSLEDGSCIMVDRYVAQVYVTGDMYFRDGMLMVDGNGISDCYVIDDEGKITKTVERSSVAEFYDVDSDYITYTYASGRIRHSLPLAFRYKKVVTGSFDSQMLTEADSGRSSDLGGSVKAANEELLLICEKQNDKNVYGTIKLKSGEYNYLFKSDEEKSFIAIDEQFAYYFEVIEDTNLIFGKVNLDNGKESEVFRYEPKDMAVNYALTNAFYPTVIGDTLFMAETHDYGLYLQAVNLTSGNSVVSDECFYDTGIAGLGKVSFKSNVFKADDGKELSTASSATLVLDKKFAGADAINQILADDSSLVFENQDNTKQEVTQSYEDYEDKDEFYWTYSFTLGMPQIEYFDGHILSVVNEGYDYFGGAHGSAYYDQHLFNVDTGREYKLPDVVNISEEEFIEKVKAAFLENIDYSENSMYWEKDEVEEYLSSNLSLDYNNFYFTEEGVKIFFYPYELAAYAQGFPEVIIPYDELGIDLKALAEDKEVVEEVID